MHRYATAYLLAVIVLGALLMLANCTYIGTVNVEVKGSTVGDVTFEVDKPVDASATLPLKLPGLP